MLSLYCIMTILRYCFEGLFCYLIFNEKKSNNTAIKISNIKRAVIFLAVYVMLTAAYRYRYFLLPEKFDSTTRIFSALVIFVYFIFENKIRNTSSHATVKRVNLNYILTFSILISLITEISFQSCYLINRFTMFILGISDTMMVLNVELYTSIDIALHLALMLLICKTKLIRPKIIKDLSTRKLISAFLGIFLLMIIYVKYCFHQSLFGSETSNILLIGLMFVVFMSFISYWNLLELTKLKNMENNRVEENILNLALKDAKLKNNLRFNEETHKAEMEYFKNVLRKIGMKEMDKKFNQLAFAAVLLKHHRNIDEVDLTPDILSYIGEVLNIKPKSVHANFRNALNRHWLLEDLDTLEENYKGPISENSGAPTPKEFLIYIVKNAINEEAKKIETVK